MQFESAVLEDEGNVLRLRGAEFDLRFHGIWLRDNAQDAATRDPGNGQRMITLADLPEDCALADARIDSRKVHVTFAADGKQVEFDAAWLGRHGYDIPHDRMIGRLPEHAEVWDSGLSGSLPTGALIDLQSNRAALRDWLFALRRYGFAKVTGLRAEPGALFDVVDLFGYVRTAL